jgi:AraC-like DNA-binding protein
VAGSDDDVAMPARATPDQGYLEQRPVPALAGIVASVWTQTVASDAEPYVQRSIPHGGIDLVCALGSAPRIVGPLTGPKVDVLAPGTTLVGVRFRPGSAGSLCRMPASELVDLVVPAEDVLGREAAELAGRVLRAERPATVLQRFVAARVADAERPDPVVTETVRRLQANQYAAVSSLRSTLHLSERQLRRRCHAEVGLSPKVLHRVLRFQYFLALAQRNFAEGPPATSVSRLANDAGYAEQAHLSRECRRLTGQTPRTLIGEMTHRCADHDHAASFEALTDPRRRYA